MRRWFSACTFFVVVASGAAASPGAEPMVIVLDWVQGTSSSTGAAGFGVEAESSWPVWIDACHRQVWVDLLYEPSELEASAGGNGVALPYEFRVFLDVGGATFDREITTPGFSHILVETPHWGDAEVTLRLERGLLVDWSLRVRAWEIPGEPACVPQILVNEVEANPTGVDAGNEWVELYNPGTFDVAVGGWFIESTHGITHRSELPVGLVVPRGGHVQVLFADQFLDNLDESVRLLLPDLQVHDATLPRSDEANDADTWQRDPDGSATWSLRAGTPGTPNAS